MKEFFVKLGKGIAKPFAKLGEVLSAFFKKHDLDYSFSKYKSFTALQARETFNYTPIKDRKDKVISIVMPILKFILVIVVGYVVMMVSDLFGIIQINRIFETLVFIVSLTFVFQVLSSMSNCTKSFYLAEDNKVLITFPSSGSTLFLSKVTIQYLRELKSAMNVFIPIMIGILLYGSSEGVAQFGFFSVIWVIPMIAILIAFEVLFGSLLSVIWLGFLRFIKKFPFIQIALYFIIAAGFAVAAVMLINLIPENIELISTWNDIKANINGFLTRFTEVVFPIKWFVSIIVGEIGYSYFGHRLQPVDAGKFFILLAIVIVMFLIVFYLIKLLFLKMMTKNIDYEKVHEGVIAKNKVRGKYITFTYKELKISFRTIEISGSYLLTYLIIPILILLLCKIFAAIDTSITGNNLTIMFDMLLICLPLLASNANLASAYSREGRAGYIKKTKPVNPLFPLFSKLVFNLFFSIPSILASIIIVGKFASIDIVSLIFMGISILLLQYAHIFYTSTIDITKPRNEHYATEGDTGSNPNESLSTILAFVMSFAFALLTFFFYKEASGNPLYDHYIFASLRMLLFASILFASCLTLYILKVRAYFQER